MKYILILICMLLCSCSKQQDKSRRIQETPIPIETALPAPSAALQATSTPVAENNIISAFKTPLLDKTAERVHNIKLAADAVNNCKVKKGEIFSFNDTVGNRSEERGYKIASVLIGAEHGTGVGGGVCQVATTIYNAVKKADMNIIEHHNHKAEVEYAPNGTDATVNYDNLDFKFKNNTDYDITIMVEVRKDDVYVEIKKV